jgi:Flp pilus assembly protein TadG
MKHLLRRFRTREEERGQALVLFAFGLVAFCGLVALSIDAGQLVFTRTDLQKVADAAVFAGSQDLPNAGSAENVANQYVSYNAGSSTTADVVIGHTYAANDTITVTTHRRVNYTFLRVLGVTGADVTARATVRVGTFSGARGIVPFALVASDDPNSTLFDNPCYLGNDANGLPIFKQNTSCQLKGGANSGGAGGDFGALGIAGTGANLFRETVANGYEGTVFVGDQIIPQTGNQSGPTTQGLGDRMLMPPPEGCPSNERDDVLITHPDGSVTVREECAESMRIIIIPIVDQIDNPQYSTVLGFAFMYVYGVSGSGGNTTVFGEYVSFTSEIPGAVYQGFSGGGPIVGKLIE